MKFEFFGDNVRVERAKRKITQRELATLAKVDKNTIANIENGGNVIIEKAIRIANALDVSLEYLLTQH